MRTIIRKCERLGKEYYYAALTNNEGVVRYETTRHSVEGARQALREYLHTNSEERVGRVEWTDLVLLRPTTIGA